MTQPLHTEPSASEPGTNMRLAHLRSVVRHFDTTTLITRRRNGGLHGRPMSVAGVDDDVTIWLITSAASPKVAEISDDGRALMTFQRSTQFAALNGQVDLVYDRDKIWELWRESYRIWYDGKSDPDIVLLRFTPYDAEYWDSSGAKGIAYVFKAVRAYALGETLAESSNVETDPALHGTVDLARLSLTRR